MKPAKRKAKMMQNPVCNEETPTLLPAAPPQASHPQRIYEFVSKQTFQDSIESDDDCFAGNEGDESNTSTSDNASDSADSDDDVYT